MTPEEIEILIWSLKMIAIGTIGSAFFLGAFFAMFLFLDLKSKTHV